MFCLHYWKREITKYERIVANVILDFFFHDCASCQCNCNWLWASCFHTYLSFTSYWHRETAFTIRTLDLHKSLNAGVSVMRPVLFSKSHFQVEKKNEECNETMTSLKCANCRQKYTWFLEGETREKVFAWNCMLQRRLVENCSRTWRSYFCEKLAEKGDCSSEHFVRVRGASSDSEHSGRVVNIEGWRHS